MKPFRCPACGTGEVVPARAPGRTLAHKNLPNLELPESLAIPTCTECGEEWLDAAATQSIQEAAEAAYETALAVRAEKAIERLRESISQRDLERLLGLSPAYLSKLKGGKTPGAPLVATLFLLASDSKRVEDLRAFWRTGDLTEPRAKVLRLVPPPPVLRRLDESIPVVSKEEPRPDNSEIDPMSVLA